MVSKLFGLGCIIWMFIGCDIGLGKSTTLPSRKLFLSVGLGEFQDQRWPRLNFAGKDAVDVGAALRPSFDGGIVLSDRNRKDPIKRDEILAALQQLALQNVNEDDTIIVYFSTHGTLAQSVTDGRRAITKFLVSGDTEYDRVAETGLKIPEILDRFQALKSRRKALIIDSCYSGQGKAHITPGMLEFLAKQKAGSIQAPVEQIDESTGVYSASAWGEEAQEDSRLQNGVYTHFLLRSLQDDLNGDGAIQLSEAHTQATSLVIEFTKGAQHPSAQVEIVGQDPVILRGELRQNGLPLLLAWRRDLRNYLVNFNGKALGNMGKGVLSLPQGKGRLEFIDPETQQLVHATKVDLQANETYLLESFLAEDRSHQLRLRAGWSWFRQTNARDWISEKALPFTGLSYQYQDAFTWADVGFSLDLLAPVSDSVLVEGKRLGEPLGLQLEEQTLKGFRADLKLMREHRLNWLTDYSRRWQTRWLGAVGPSYIQLERTFPKLNQSDVASSLGLNVETGLEIYWNFRHLSWQILVQYSGYVNQWTQNEKLVDILTFGSALGIAL